MKKNLFALAICLAFIVLISGCTGGGGPAIDRQQAQLAFAAALVAEFDALPLMSGGTDGVDWADNGTVLPDLKRKNLAGTLAFEWNPNDGNYPNTQTLTTIGYLEAQTGYTLGGTVVGIYTDSTHSSSTYNLTLSHPTLVVTSITGTLTTVNSVVTGSLSFNGVPYTWAELMSQ